MSRFIVTAPVLALAATAAPAYADAPPMTWTGFYVGIHGGFVDTNPEWHGHNIYQTVVDGGEGSLTLMPHTDTIAAKPSHSEFGGGGRLGYNFQAGSVVFGLEADATLFSYTGSVTSTSPLATYTLTSHASNLETLRARAGFAFGNALIFGTGGLAWSNLHHTLMATDHSQVIVDGGEGGHTIGAATANLADAAKNHSGWTAGGGGELRVSPNLAISLTLLHVDFQRKDLFANSGPSSIGAQVHTTMFEGMLGVNYRF